MFKPNIYKSYFITKNKQKKFLTHIKKKLNNKSNSSKENYKLILHFSCIDN